MSFWIWSAFIWGTDPEREWHCYPGDEGFGWLRREENEDLILTLLTTSAKTILQQLPAFLILSSIQLLYLDHLPTPTSPQYNSFPSPPQAQSFKIPMDQINTCTLWIHLINLFLQWFQFRKFGKGVPYHFSICVPRSTGCSLFVWWWYQIIGVQVVEVW